MKLILLAILLGTFHLNTLASSNISTSYFQNDSLFAAGDTTGLPDLATEKENKPGLFNKLKTLGKREAFLYLFTFIGGILLLRFSAPVLRFTDQLLLRFQHRPNTFDGFRYTGNPFILKGPFYALYHLFLGRNSYQSYLVWPLKYGIAISFIATIVIRLLPDESFHTIQTFQALLFSSLTVQITFGLIFLAYLLIAVLLCIESIRKTKWLFPIRLLVFLPMGFVIFAFMYWLFWLIVVIAILYLFTYIGKGFISLQKDAASQGYSEENFIYEPWPDASSKNYPNT